MAGMTAMTTPSVNAHPRPAAPATARPRKISWLAYAIDERASGAKVARDLNLLNFSKAETSCW
jgi:hypothetical protein